MSQRFLPLRVPVSLRTLLPAASFVGCADIRVTDATESSAQCGPHTLFAAIPGSQTDGASFVEEALEHGASSLLVQRPLPNVGVPQCVVPNVRRAYAELCASLAGSPSRYLNLAGVTGTNGKTTVTWLIRSILETSGHRTGLLGTIEYHNGVDSSPAPLTTPDPKTLANWLSAMISRDTNHAAMEVSSHALDQDRTAGVQFDAVIVTNITQDHFDYHDGIDGYREAKARILDQLKPQARVVLNADDRESAAMARRIPDHAQLVTYGLEKPAAVWGTILEESLRGTRFVLHRGDQAVQIATALPGRHNVSNCLAAAAATERFGLSLPEIKAGIEALRLIPGRFERVECGQRFDVFIDYAHTEDALRRGLAFLKRAARGRVICVVGAGGDRDRSKRPLIGRAASAADLAIITSDNPRNEDPEQIIRDIVSGFAPDGREPVIEIDRAEAIRRAIESAEPGDCVLVAGKGHEREQIVGNRRIPFVDRDIVRESLSRSASQPAPRPSPDAAQSRKLKTVDMSPSAVHVLTRASVPTATGTDEAPAMDRLTLNDVLAATGGRPALGHSLSADFDGISTDSRTTRPGELFWALRGPRFDGQRFIDDAAESGAAACVIESNKPASLKLPAILVDDTHEALRDFACWHRRRMDALVVGVTGSVGKTTTREMIYAVLAAGAQGCRSPRNFNNDVGLPLSVLAIERRHQFAVLEMGASKPGDIRRLCDVARPQVGVVTRIGPAHLETFKSLRAILETKRELIEALPSSGFAVLNGDDRGCRNLARRARCRVISIGQNNGNTIRATHVESSGEELRFVVDGKPYRIRAAGRHHLTAALAALAVGRERGMSCATIAEGLDRFAPVGGRCQIKQVDGLTLIDDTYNANPSSVEAACELLAQWKTAGRRILVLGQMAEMGEHTSKWHQAVGRLAAKSRLDRVAALGPNAEDVVCSAAEQGMSSKQLAACDDLDALQSTLDGWLQPGDTVLVKGSRSMRMERVTEWLEHRNSKETTCPRGNTRACA